VANLSTFFKVSCHYCLLKGTILLCFFFFLIGARTEQSMLELILNQMGEWNFFCFEFYLLMFNLNLPLSLM
jgi:hypothetical protein